MTLVIYAGILGRRLTEKQLVLYELFLPCSSVWFTPYFVSFYSFQLWHLMGMKTWQTDQTSSQESRVVWRVGHGKSTLVVGGEVRDL